MNDRVRVLHLVSSLSVGGAERLVLGLVETFDRTHFDLHVCSLTIVHGNPLQRFFERLRVPLTIIDAKHFYDLKAVLEIMRYVRQHRIEIIHTHLPNADVIGRVVGCLLRRPVISTLQNEPCDYNRKRFDQRWLTRLTARLFPVKLIAVSQRIRTMFIKEWHIPPERIVTIYNAVPMEVLTALPPAAERQTPSSSIVITCVARLSPQKGHHYLLAAAQQVLIQRPNVHFMLVGQGRLEVQLKAQVRKLGIEQSITFTGLRHDVPDVLSESDIFVLSSLWEGLPLTAIEAMAAARPVVLTDVGGNRDLVETGKQGLLVPPADASALARALLQLVDDAETRNAMGLAARARVRHDFNIATIAAQHEALYTSLLPRSRHSSP